MTNEERAYIAQQQDVIDRIEKKRPALELIVEGWRRMMDTQHPAGRIDIDSIGFEEALYRLAVGYAEFYTQELATMDEIKLRFEQTKKQLGANIVMPSMVPPKVRQ